MFNGSPHSGLEFEAQTQHRRAEPDCAKRTRPKITSIHSVLGDILALHSEISTLLASEWNRTWFAGIAVVLSGSDEMNRLSEGRVSGLAVEELLVSRNVFSTILMRQHPLFAGSVR